MAYARVSDLKQVLQIGADDESFDSEIEGCIASGDALVDGLLKRSGLSVPECVPQLIVDASVHFAAWLFRHRRDPEKAEVFWAEAHKFLDAYISAEDRGALRSV